MPERYVKFYVDGGDPGTEMSEKEVREHIYSRGYNQHYADSVLDLLEKGQGTVRVGFVYFEKVEAPPTIRVYYDLDAEREGVEDTSKYLCDDCAVELVTVGSVQWMTNDVGDWTKCEECGAEGVSVE